ncbi:MAG TPA: YXWGXW repeat-containing protein [Polyangiaceae bacterium]|nr:YXWGXW repeat-containing protein [Polyangiaceae bacterium]
MSAHAPRRRARRWAALAACAAVGACGASTPLVPKGPHPAHIQEFVEVAYPPPPAQVEEIPNGISDTTCAWVDGHYAWEGRRWEWQAGRWVRPVAGCYYAEPVVAWSRAGEERLYFTPPRWYKEGAAELSERAALCSEPPVCKP